MCNLTASRETPYDDHYATCEETHVKLRIFTEDLHPETITEMLRLTPTKIIKKGEIKNSKTGDILLSKKNAWIISSEKHVASKDLRRHLDWLLRKLSANAKAIRDIQAMPNVLMSVVCVWWSAYGHGGPALWPEQMKILADLNLECSFDIYFVSETMEEIKGESHDN